MKNGDIGPKVIEILSETLNVDKEDIKPDSRLQADLGAESMDILDLAFQLREEFGIEIFDKDLEAVNDGLTVSVVVGCVEKKLQAAVDPQDSRSTAHPGA